MFFIIDSHGTVFDGDAFAGEGDDALDNVLVVNIGWYSTGHGVFDAFGFVFGDGFFVFIKEDNNLPAIGDVFIAGEMSPGNSCAINYDAVVVVKGVFHAFADDVVRAIDISIKKNST